jgi:hypothetical protein
MEGARERSQWPSNSRADAEAEALDPRVLERVIKLDSAFAHPDARANTSSGFAPSCHTAAAGVRGSDPHSNCTISCALHGR